jgi:hypothetical protein
LVLRSQNRQYRRIQDEVGIRSRFVEPEIDALEGRAFVLVSPGKDKFRGKSKGSRNNNKRGRRSRKSPQSKSSNHGSGHHNGRRKGKGKRNTRSRGRLKKADSRA